MVLYLIFTWFNFNKYLDTLGHKLCSCVFSNPGDSKKVLQFADLLLYKMHRLSLQCAHITLQNNAYHKYTKSFH